MVQVPLAVLHVSHCHRKRLAAKSRGTGQRILRKSDAIDFFFRFLDLLFRNIKSEGA